MLLTHFGRSRFLSLDPVAPTRRAAPRRAAPRRPRLLTEVANFCYQKSVDPTHSLTIVCLGQSKDARLIGARKEWKTISQSVSQSSTGSPASCTANFAVTESNRRVQFEQVSIFANLILADEEAARWSTWGRNAMSNLDNGIDSLDSIFRDPCNCLASNPTTTATVFTAAAAIIIIVRPDKSSIISSTRVRRLCRRRRRRRRRRSRERKRSFRKQRINMPRRNKRRRKRRRSKRKEEKKHTMNVVRRSSDWQCYRWSDRSTAS